MKIILTILCLLNGGYMLTDGIFVLIKKKYIGPDKPGPWANIFYKLGIDIFKLSPLFVVLGISWLMFLFALWTNQSWAFTLGLIVSILTLWYLPVGIIISILVIIVLIASRQKLGI